jgi:transposase
MREGLFWLDDLQWSSIRGFLPGRKRRGPRRVDGRRVIRRIIHVLQSGMRWRDCPKEYGPSTTIYNRCFDGKAAVPLLKPLPPPKKLLADKAYDCAAFRDWLSRRGTTPVIPNKINRRKPYPHNKRPIGTATRSSACSAISASESGLGVVILPRRQIPRSATSGLTAWPSRLQGRWHLSLL